MRSDISYLALDSVEDGALVASSYYKPPVNQAMASPTSLNGGLSGQFSDVNSESSFGDGERVGIIGARKATGYAAPSSLATMASVAHAGVKFKAKLKAARKAVALKAQQSQQTLASSSSKVLHRGTTSASLLSIENDHSMLQADYIWANHHALLTVWPTAAVRLA